MLAQAWVAAGAWAIHLKPSVAGCAVYAARDARPPPFDATGWDDPARSCLPRLPGHPEQDAKRIGARRSTR